LTARRRLGNGIMLDDIIFNIPLAVAVAGMALTGVLALRSRQRRPGAWLAFGIASLGTQVTLVLQYASTFATMAAQAARPAPTDRHRYAFNFVPPSWLHVVAWLCWALAVAALVRTVRASAGPETRSWWRPALGLVLIAGTVVVLQRVEARLDELVGETMHALFQGESRLSHRSAAQPESVGALAAISVRRIDLHYGGKGVLGVAVDKDGRASQWDTYAPHAPAEPILLSGPLESAFVNELYACGVSKDGRASCAAIAPWVGTPGSVTGLGDARVTFLAPAPIVQNRVRVCALSAEGAARCWGAGGQGILEEEPGLPFGTGLRAMTPAFGYVGCAAGQDGRVRCWVRELAVQILGGEVAGLDDVIAVASSTERACAIERGGRVGCWELDPATIRARGRAAWEARIVPDLRATQVSVAETHACAVEASGKVACWGYNRWGGLCDGTTEDRTSPVAAIGVSDAVMVSTQASTTCILRSSGAVACCGKQRR
jgi:hypothetical protein